MCGPSVLLYGRHLALVSVVLKQFLQNKFIYLDTVNESFFRDFFIGQNPYPGMDAKIVPMKVKSGYRMSVPEFCPET